MKKKLLGTVSALALAVSFSTSAAYSHEHSYLCSVISQRGTAQGFSDRGRQDKREPY